MKQLIVPIAIIVALIAFFVIVDHKEFSRHDDVQTVQSESSTTNRKPLVSVPETKPATKVKPAVEAKPVGTKPVAEIKPEKPADTKPVAEIKPEKPADTKPVAQTKPGEELLPAAVPVVTAEEAEKLNEDAKAYALAEKEKREPFYRLYQDYNIESVRNRFNVFQMGRCYMAFDRNRRRYMRFFRSLLEFSRIIDILYIYCYRETV